MELLRDLIMITLIELLNNISAFLQGIDNKLELIFKYITTNDTIFSGIVSGLGSLLGGIIGAAVAAIVAFKVAKNQINIEKNKEVKKKNMENRNYLISLIHELENNKLIYELMSKDKENDKTGSLEDSVWQNIRFSVNDFISLEQYKILEEIYREIKDVKNKELLKYREEINYQLRSELLKRVINELTARLGEIETYLEYKT